MAQTFKSKTLLGRSGIFSHEVIAPNLIYNTGDQTISGNKNFTQNVIVGDQNQDNLFIVSGNDISFGVRPTVNGTGVLLIGEAPENTVFTTGDQSINGIKTFINGSHSQILLDTEVGSDGTAEIIFKDEGSQILSIGQDQLNTYGYGETNFIKSIADLKILNNNNTPVITIPKNEDAVYINSNVYAGNLVYNTGEQFVSGLKKFNTRPTVNTSPVLLSGEAITSGDLTGHLPYPTINKLQGYKLDLNGGAADGQILQWNAASSSWRAGAIPAGGNGGGGLVYYFDFANRSGIAPTGGLPTTGDHALSLLGTQYAIGSGQATSNELDPRFVDRLLCSFVTASGNPQVTNIPAGLWDFNIWASVDNASAIQCSIRAVVNIYNPTNSTYRYLASTDDVYLYETDTIAQYILNATVPQTGIANNERIYIQFFGKKYTANNRTITLYFDSYRPSHVHTTIPSVAGDGVVKVVNGVFQSPATGIFNADVDNNANINQSKILNLTSDLATLRTSGQTLDSKINSLSGNLTANYATITNLASTGSNLNNIINNLSGYINSTSSNIVFTTGNQTISGVKSFAQDTTFGDSAQGDFLVISGNNFTVYGSGNFTSGLFVNGNAVLTGVNLTPYATIANLASTGSTLNTKIDNLSGVSVLRFGDQIISGVKTFIGNHNISGNTTVSGFIKISGNYDLYAQIENSKKLAIAYAIAL